MAELPTWSQLVSLIASTPKPPIRARIVDSSPGSERKAWVVHDGQDVWHIDDGDRIELSSPASTTLIDDGRFETIAGMGVASNNWVKTMFQGRLIAYLASATGDVVGSETFEGRMCWVVEMQGLRAKEPEAEFRMWVDAETGITLRLERADLDGIVVWLDNIEVGTAITAPEQL